MSCVAILKQGRKWNGALEMAIMHSQVTEETTLIKYPWTKRAATVVAGFLRMF